jgi:hypothetical protein
MTDVRLNGSGGGADVTAGLPAPGRIRRWEILLWCAMLPLMAVPMTYAAIRCAQESQSMLEGWDGQFYYAILRSAVFDHNADLRNELRLLTPSAAKDPAWGADLDRITDPVSGQLRCKYTVGWAIVASPGYLLVRAWDLIRGAPANGYELRYQVGADLSILVAGWLGLLASYALARRLCGPWPAAWATMLVLMGSALFFYTVESTFMSHGASFFAVSAFIYVACSIAWGRFQGSGYWLLLGLLAGLMCVIRPTNVFYGLFGLYPLAARLRSPEGRGKRLFLDVALAVAGGLPAAGAQMLFWLGNFGKPLVFSYGPERFFWGEPRWLPFLVSQRHGLFFYAPVLLLSLAGLLWTLASARSLRSARIAAGLGLLCLAALVYVNSCWWVWWFQGGFGTRSMVDGSAVWILGLGLLLADLKGKTRIGVTAVGVACCIVTVTLLGLLTLNRWPSYSGHSDPKLKGLSQAAPDYYHRVHNID